MNELFTSHWNLNPRNQDLNPAKTHGTWFQDLIKLRFLMSQHRKNSVRDNVIDKKWAYSDSEGNTLHRVWAIAEDEGGYKKWTVSFLGCCSVGQLYLTLCNPVYCSRPGLPVPHHLLEFAQTHVRGVSDTIQPSHPLSSPSPPAFNLSQHQGLFH